MGSKDRALVVVAIDFGTTYSGYAYSFRSEYKDDHTKVYSNTEWKSGDGLVTSKTPTVVLFDKDKKFKMFGYEAQLEYNRLLEDDEADGWRYFSLFKMELFRAEAETTKHTKSYKITKTLMIKDSQGEPMPALVVFSECIRYLTDHFLNCNHISGFKLKPKYDVHWVLTVPAIWTDRAKQFMREAAKLADIDDAMLTLAYEPEAAAIYCKELTVQKKESAEERMLSSFDSGQEFLVLDCGGGTVDITVYQIQEDGNLREIERPTGGPWGGTCVDRRYTQFLQELFGEAFLAEYSQQHPEDFLDILRQFEVKKKCVNPSSTQQTRFTYPRSLLDKYQKTTKCRSTEEYINTSRFAKSVKMKYDKLYYDHEFVKDFFKEPIGFIVQHLRFLLYETKLSTKKINTILMVGGFSDSSVLSERIISEFNHLSVICPKEAVNAIMKGAVIFGHNQDVISERISPRTYGISVNRPFKNGDPEKLKMNYDGKLMCTDIFYGIIHKGQSVLVGEQVFRHMCLPTRALDTEATIEIYESLDQAPMYTIDKGVRRLGDLTVSIPDTSKGKNRRIYIEMMFGYTEIKVRAFEESSGNACEAAFNCMLH